MLIISRPSLEYIYFNTKKVKIIIFMPDLATISEKRRKSRESIGVISAFAEEAEKIAEQRQRQTA